MADVPVTTTMLPQLPRVKLGATTVRGKVVVCVCLPDVPVTVNVWVPSAAELLAVSVTVEFEVIGLGKIDAVTPLGRPDMARFTSPANPYSGLMYRLIWLELPWPIVVAPEL